MIEEHEITVTCPACDTETQLPLERASETIQRHNDRMHAGEAIATVDPVIKDELARIIAEDLDLL